MKKLTYERVRELFDYDPETGNLTWKKVTCSRPMIGKVAGHKHSSGRIYIGLFGKSVFAHRLVWLWHYGYLPDSSTEIDHINRNNSDNRIENLRIVSRICNMRNTGNKCTNTSGVKGVHFNKKIERWESYIMVKYEKHYLGLYSNFNDAVLARLAAEQCLGWSGCDSASPAYRYALENGLIKK